MRITLDKALWVALLGLAAMLVFAFFRLKKDTDASVAKTAIYSSHIASAWVGGELEAYLRKSTAAADHLAQQLVAGKCRGPETESCLLVTLLSDRHFSEVSITEAKEAGFNAQRLTVFEPEGRHELAVYRSANTADSEVCTREVSGSGDFSSTTRCRGPTKLLTETGAPVRAPATDPAIDDAFEVAASEFQRGKVLRTDLAWSDLDRLLPEENRRVVLTELRSVDGHDDRLIWVIKISLGTAQIAELVLHPEVSDTAHHFLLFVADDQGRLLTPIGPNDVLAADGDDLRFMPKEPPEEIVKALTDPSLGKAEPGHPSQTEFELRGERYFVTYRLLGDTQGWRLVSVVPEREFATEEAQARAAQEALFWEAGVGFGLMLLGGWLALRVIRRAFFQIQQETTHISAFNFESATSTSRFADVRDTLFSLEKAKTAVRAMGKYVPLALVRQLFETNKEPTLGDAALREVTIFFSDIEGFTTRAEAEAPDVVARWLGQYLEVMTAAVHAEGGTVDKFIGDSVMALWNAPNPSPNHVAQACRAALRCQRECVRLFTSPAWEGRPPLVTRIGLHVDSVMVGHFGAPDRLSYTAIGDGVNLASRIEGLNKQYGTTLLVSEEVFKRAGDGFAFRRLDTVAVKGKSHPIGVYELLGERDQPTVPPQIVERYEQALALYCAGKFEQARVVLAENRGDLPSAVLAGRCGELERMPPVQPWTGISFMHSK